MNRADESRVADTIAAADGLASRLTMPYEQWLTNEDLRLMTERLVEIVVEAVRSLSDGFCQEHPDLDWSGFIGLRTILVPAYHRIDPGLLWQAADRRPSSDGPPPLKIRIDIGLDSSPAPGT